MVKVILSKSKGYKWFTSNGVSFKGYFLYHGSGSDLKLYREYEAVNVFEKIKTIEDLKNLLEEIDGNYCVIINKEDYTLAAVDRARSLPLYFSNAVVSDSAEIIRGEHGIPKDAVDLNNYIEFAAVTYLTGHQTVYSEIKQLDLGEIVKIENDHFLFEKYFYHLNTIIEKPISEVKKELIEVSYRSFYRIKEAIAGRPVVLSMSGGYDSRFVGCMLKNVGVEDVSCYTYGRKDSFEVLQSKRNAEALGFRWTFVEYTDDLMKNQLDEICESYIDYYQGHDYLAYMQNFPAVRKLHEIGWIKKDSVFLTGLCGDMPTGAYVRAEQKGSKYDIRALCQKYYNSLFNSFYMDDNFKQNRLKTIEEEVSKLPIKIKDYQSWQSAYDCLYTGSCHSHAYMHMNSVHQFFGYEFLMPFWDKELLLKWYSVPVRYRINQKLYEDILINDICKPYGIGTKKTFIRYSRNKVTRLLIYNAGAIISYILLHLGLPFRRKADFNNFAPLELELFKRIKVKKAICYKKSGFDHLLCQYILEKKYGIDNYKLFHNKTKVKINY